MPSQASGFLNAQLKARISTVSKQPGDGIGIAAASDLAAAMSSAAMTTRLPIGFSSSPEQRARHLQNPLRIKILEELDMGGRSGHAFVERGGLVLAHQRVKHEISI
jgi:hypothetical protein